MEREKKQGSLFGMAKVFYIPNRPLASRHLFHPSSTSSAAPPWRTCSCSLAEGGDRDPINLAAAAGRAAALAGAFWGRDGRDIPRKLTLECSQTRRCQSWRRGWCLVWTKRGGARARRHPTSGAEKGCGHLNYSPAASPARTPAPRVFPSAKGEEWSAETSEPGASRTGWPIICGSGMGEWHSLLQQAHGNLLY
jgi:hypothetical protein